MKLQRNTAGGVLKALGFDEQVLPYAMRTALAACIALFTAWLLKLEHPQWAAMTVWAASQPVRGHLLEKGLFRVVGTLIGVIFGIGLMWLADGNPFVLTLGLTVWIGLCAATGNLLRSFAAYGAMLAGYSAAMVTLLEAAHPDKIVEMGVDRFLTITVGVGVALLIGWFFAKRQETDPIVAGTRILTSKLLRQIAADLTDKNEPHDRDETQAALLAEMAAIEDALDGHGAGSFNRRRTARAIRILFIRHMALMAGLRDVSLATDEKLAGALGNLADALENDIASSDASSHLRIALALSRDRLQIRDMLHALAAALRDGTVDLPQASVSAESLVLHRDWLGALQAMIRAGLTIFVIGTVWSVTGLSVGPFMMLGASIMVTIFSAFDMPHVILRSVVFGQAFGALGAIACRWLVWPLASSQAELLVLVLPFILFGALIMAHRRTARFGFDYNMVLLLLLQPAFPLTGTPGHSFLMMGAVVAGPTLGLAAFTLIYPVSLQRRFDTLIAMMVHDLEAMSAPDGHRHDIEVWRMRFYHRVLRLVRLAGRIGEAEITAARTGMTIFAVGKAVRQIHEAVDSGTANAEISDRLRLTLRDLQSLSRDPQRCARSLERTADRLHAEAGMETSLLARAAALIDENAAQLQRAEKAGLRGLYPTFRFFRPSAMRP
ncbi:FUSC family protein [Rhizobium sp. NRK18]|uniref:FUSC family protein n=1 Tax=Rhizobium sp. NRK18 TaxID=2964667 RepID=UPI0021C453ED|nr:FUSC family protein [Rhizobium sp. NRK18]MCQ2002692.1 FUSC family protein [Rhizobium sp. NRK18]